MTKTKKYSLTVVAALTGFCLAGAGSPAQAQEKAAGSGTLKVKVHYTGAGTVDQKHKIILFIFDTPDFMRGGGAMPVGSQNTAAKDDTVTFTDVAKSPVYLIAVYDPTGAYEGMSPPPSGSSMGVYAKQPPQVDPIKIDAGKTAQVDLAFDDSFKMP